MKIFNVRSGPGVSGQHPDLDSPEEVNRPHICTDRTGWGLSFIMHPEKKDEIMIIMFKYKFEVLRI